MRGSTTVPKILANQARLAKLSSVLNLTRDSFSGFFLPPRQTAEGIRVYTGMVNKLRDVMGAPSAVKTGVNYPRPRPNPNGRKIRARGPSGLSR